MIQDRAYTVVVFEIGARARTQAPPPHIMFEALVEPDRDPARPWLHLLGDETRPRIREARHPELVVWSSIWLGHPDALIRFDLSAAGDGTRLRWSAVNPDPITDPAILRHLRFRMNRLINADLRESFDQ